MIRQRLNEKFGEDGKDGEDSYIATVGGDETIIAVPFKNIKQDYLSAIETIAGFIEEVKEEVKKSEYNFFGQELKLRSSFTDFVSTSKKEGSITEDTRFLGEIFETLVKVDIALSHAKEREKKGDNSTLYVFGHESRLIGKPREIYEKTKGKFEIHDYTNKDWEKIQEDNSLVSMHSWITPSSNVWKQLNEGRFLIHDEELTM